MKQDFTIWRNQILQNPRDISPLKFGISQDEVIEIFGNPDAVSTMRSDGKPLILKYHDIELHFDRKAPHGLCLIYSDDDTTSTGRSRGRIGTVLWYVPRWTRLHLLIIWPATKTIFTRMMR